MMEWIYWSISFILLKWHSLWDMILPGDAQWLGTNWDWILAIVFLVITVRIILFPIFVKQIRSQRAMQALQPKMKELQTKYKGDQQTLREEMMKLYQTEKVNPLMGCLPMFLQIPVFLGLFHILQRLDPVQSVNTTLYGWTQQQWDSAAAARLFTAPIAGRFADGADQLSLLEANGTTVKIVAGVLVIIMMFTTYMTSRQMILKTGWNPDPQQRMIQKLMLYGIPISLLLSGWYFPIGVIVYWVTQNIVSFGQQYWVLHKYPPPATAGAVPATGGNIFGRIPVAGETAALTKAPPPDRPVPKAKGTGGGFVSPVQEETRSGLFRRTAEAGQPTVVTPTKSLGPTPGAKPAASKAAPPAATANGSKPSANGATAAGPSKPATEQTTTPTPTQATATPAAAKPAAGKSSAGAKASTGGKASGGANRSKGNQGGKSGGKRNQPSKKGGPRR